MDLGRPANNTEARALISMVQYYRGMWPRRSHILAPLTQAFRGPNSRKILWNDALEIYVKELKCMVSAETMLNFHIGKCHSQFTLIHPINSYVQL